MKLIDTLTNFFFHSREQTKDQTPQGICSLCWGYESYDGKIREFFEDKQIDINNHKKRYMIIQDFLANHIDGPKLKRAHTKECNECKDNKLVYK